MPLPVTLASSTGAVVNRLLKRLTDLPRARRRAITRTSCDNDVGMVLPGLVAAACGDVEPSTRLEDALRTIAFMAAHHDDPLAGDGVPLGRLLAAARYQCGDVVRLLNASPYDRRLMLMTCQRRFPAGSRPDWHELATVLLADANAASPALRRVRNAYFAAQEHDEAA